MNLNYYIYEKYKALSKMEKYINFHLRISKNLFDFLFYLGKNRSIACYLNK